MQQNYLATKTWKNEMKLSNDLQTEVDLAQFSKRIDMICEFAKQGGSVRTGKKGKAVLSKSVF